MKSLQSLTILALATLVLAGSANAMFWKKKETKDSPIPKSKQERFLSKTKMPQQFGYSIYRTRAGTVACVGEARLHPNHMASVKMLEDGIPVVKMQGMSKRSKMNVLLDTSSPNSWIEFSAAQKLDVHFLGINDQPFPYRGSYNTGGAAAFAGVAGQVRIDTLFLENVPFYVRMSIGSLGPLARGIKKPQVDAVMGFDTLRIFEYVQFDLKNSTVALSATTPFNEPEGDNVHVAKIIPSRSFGLVVEGTVNDEKKPVIIDLAGDFDFARGDIKVAVTPEVGLGDLTFLDLPTLVLPLHDSPARVGRKQLASYRITICNKSGVVYFENLATEGD